MVYELNEISDIFGGTVIHDGNLMSFKFLQLLSWQHSAGICLKMIWDFVFEIIGFGYKCVKKKKKFNYIILLDRTVHKRDFVTWRMYEPR